MAQSDIIRSEAYRVSTLLLACFIHLAGQTVDKPVRARLLSVAGTPIYSTLTINNVQMWMRYDGQSNHTPSSQPGVGFPRGTAPVIYQDGTTWGGKVFTTPQLTGEVINGQRVRVGGGTYSVGTAGGAIVGIGQSAVAMSPADPAARVYRIRRDYASLGEAAIRKEAAYINELDPVYQNASQSQIDAVRLQYASDWTNWPVQLGAPFIDRNGNGAYDPPPAFNTDPTQGPFFTAESLITQMRDEPGIAGGPRFEPAGQVLWTVYNDLNPITSAAFAGSLPIGLEIQKTVFGFNRVDVLGNVYYTRYRIINKGGVDTSNNAGNQFGTFWVDSMYFCQWSDPDLGTAGDDLIGCDTVLQLGYVYNSTSVDSDFRMYNLPPPAAGYDFLTGPLVPSPGDSAIVDFRRRRGFRNSRMSSFAYFSAGSPYSDPPGGASNYVNGSGRWWKMLRGFAPVGSMTTADQAYASGTFPISSFPLSGDPVVGSGFLDGLGTSYSFAPGDRRLLLTTGPFSMAPGDTQEVMVGFVAGMGGDRLSSIVVMKATDQIVQAMVDDLFGLPELPVISTTVSYPAASTARIQLTAVDSKKAYASVSIDLQDRLGSVVASVPLFDDGASNDGGIGDGVFGGSVTIARQPSPMGYLARLQMFSNRTITVPNPTASIRTAGDVRVTNLRIHYDNIGPDGIVLPDEYIRFGISVRNLTPFMLSRLFVRHTYASGSSTIMVPSLGSLQEFSSTYDPSRDSTFLTLQIPSGWSGSTYPTQVTINDSAGNHWLDTILVPIGTLQQSQTLWAPTSGPWGADIRLMLADSSGGVLAFPFVGAYRTTNNGDRWTKLAGNNLPYVYSGVVLENGTIILATFRGLFRSTNTGTSWQFTAADGMRDVTFGPGSVVYALGSQFMTSNDNGLTWSYRSSLQNGNHIVATSDGTLIATVFGGAYRSVDQGLSWQPSLSGFSTAYTLKRTSNNTILCGTDSAFYRSTDKGVTWAIVNMGTPAMRIQRMFIDSQGDAFVSDGSSRFCRSTDNGGSWQEQTPTVFHKAHARIRDKSGRLFGNALNSAIRSTDNGVTWEECNTGLNTLTSTGIVTTPSSILVATSGGVFRSADKGGSWTKISGDSVGSIAQGPDGALYTRASNSIKRSSDNGLSWTRILQFGERVDAFSIGPTGIMFAATTNPTLILRSTDQGLNWGSYHAPTTTITGLLAETSVNIFALNSMGMLVSTDGGTTWAQKSTYVQTLISAQSVGLVGTLSTAILMSTDHGATWTQKPTSGVSGYSIRTVAVDRNGRFIVGTTPMDAILGDFGSGVFRSSIGGSAFENLFGGIGQGSRPFVARLAIDDDGYVYAGTSYEGVYRTKVPVATGVVDAGIPESFALYQNYPNPFNPSTTIRFSLPRITAVRLAVFDILGRQVAVLLEDIRPPGVHNVVWDASNCASGAYFVRLTAGNEVQSRKMLILR